MRKSILALLVTSMLIGSCSNTDSESVKTSSNDDTASAQIAEQANTESWIASFKDFRDAVFHGRKEQVEAFVAPEFVGDNSELWNLVYKGNAKNVSEKGPAFTIHNLDPHFDMIFSREFINALLKVKTDSLFSTGEFSTQEFSRDSNTSYTMYAATDRAANTLTLHLAFVRTWTDDYGEEQRGEYSFFYRFHLTPVGEVKLQRIMVVG